MVKKITILIGLLMGAIYCFAQTGITIRNDTLFSFDPVTSTMTQLTKLVPTQAGQSGKVITTNGTIYSWITPFDGAYSSLSGKPDTSSMLTPYLRKIDTLGISNRITLKVSISDTAGMLTPYTRAITTATKVNISDTATMLSKYLRKIDTATLSARIDLKLSSEIDALSVHLTDSSAMLSKYLRKIDTLGISNRTALKVNISDTAGMLTPYTRLITTATKLNISDSAAMLTPYLRKIDTAAMLANYFRSNGSITEGQVTNLVTDLAAKAPLASPAFTGTATGIGIPVYARVTSSDATTTGQALTDVTGLTVALTTSATYEFEAVLMVTASSAAGNQYGVNYSVAGSTVEAQAYGTLAAATSQDVRITALNTATTAFVTSGASGGIVIKGIIVTTTNAGNLTIKHLKVTSGTSTIRINSFLKVTRIS